MPATQPHQCSLVELMCDEQQATHRPDVFVSHWWGEPVAEFFLSVEQHAQVRCLGKDTGYWICAYANNQHDLAEALDQDPRKTAFFLAMEQCAYVLLVLDKDATPFRRIWCCFEEAMVIQEHRDRLKPVSYTHLTLPTKRIG
eukprot:TRINITY_DN9657_c0_g2_i1.p1 TRINITY_DN9657_c0_g2~~TRINITY_DN9657_c0_g2_i1.p1  ORF type:complete len:142 (+),score=27.21 TRINITY_DN9657_c0_g2_i1:155-580(+)